MNQMKELFLRYKSVFSYLFFGALTTVVNILTYCLFYQVIAIGNIMSTIIAWLVAVAFAFVTNKLFVFERKTWDKGALKEAWQFLVCRVGTGVIEVGIMYIFVDLLAFNGMIMKLITNIIVVIVNYIASKLVIFKS